MSMYKTTPTFEDWQKKAEEYGFTVDQISEADRSIAMQNPDIGIKMLDNKNVWLTSDNESAKAWAHTLNEDYRKQYGGYSGGADGGSFIKTGNTTSAYQYDDPYETAIQSQIDRMNREFTYDPETDPNTKYYTDMYRREGERAMQDTLGAIAGTTGGIPSSYAAAAAAQQRNYYAQQLTDKYPELYQQAFDNFMAEYDRAYKTASALQVQSDSKYNRWHDRHNLERQSRQDAAAAQQQAFENDIALQEIAIQNEQIRIMNEELNLSVQKFDHEKQMAIKDDAYRWAALIQEGKIAEAEQEYKNSALAVEEKGLAWDYAVSMAELKEKTRQFDVNTQYNYDVLAEEQRQSDLDRDQQATLALIEEQLKRDQMAATVDAEKLEMAKIAASYGDFSALKELGYDVSKYEALWNMSMDEQLNPTEEDGTQDDVIDEIVMQNGGENTADVIDSIAAQAPAATIPAHIQVILKKQENGQKLTESEKIILKQYNKTGRNMR